MTNPAPNRIEIPPFPNGKRVAVTTSFDDGQVFDKQVVQAFNEWGLKGTFNLNSGKFQRNGKPAQLEGNRTYIDASEVAELYRGHEVAIHTVSHPWLERLDVTQIAAEVLEDRRALEDLVGYPVRGMAYPFGTYNAQVIGVLRNLGVRYSRTTQNEWKCFPPAEPLAWATTCHQYHSNPSVPERFEEMFSDTRRSGVFFVWGHSYEFHDKNDWEGMERIYKPLSGRSDVWYCTNIELFDYEDARHRIIIAANRRSVENPNAISVTLNVDGKLVEARPGVTTLG